MAAQGVTTKATRSENTIAAEAPMEMGRRYGPFNPPPGSGPPSPTEVRVDVGPVSQNFNRLSDTGWVVKELHFIANSTSTTLQIMDVTSGDYPFNSPLIDAVSVTSE